MGRYLLIFSLLLPVPTAAADQGAIMATLNGEKAECRYLMSLCDEVIRVSRPESLAVKGMPDVALRKFSALSDAVTVLQAKHEKAPACIEACNVKLEEAAKRNEATP